MQRRIDLLDEHYEVTVYGRPENRLLQVQDNMPQPAALNVTESGECMIQLGDQSARLWMAVKGEMAYIRSFNRTFTLRIVDPVEQAAQESGGRSNTARAPMPGTVVAVGVAAGDRVTKGQHVMTIESMKILTMIAAPRNGEVTRVHFEPGQTFDKGAVLVTLITEEE